MMDVPLNDREFVLLRNLIKADAGIALSEAKRSLLQARLGKRLRQLGLRSYREYYDYLVKHDARAEERTHFINALTTNTTAFFREPHHFEYLARTWLPAVRTRTPRGAPRILRLWSNACSTGEEAYSLAMTVCETLPPESGWDVQLLASDIDTNALTTARAGIYPQRSLDPVPKPLRRRYFQAGTGKHSGLVRVVPRLREIVRFAQLNLLGEPWPALPRFDCILCRNVVIYFDGPTQQRLVGRLTRALAPGGLLILGHSESLLDQSECFRHLGQTMYLLDAA